ncbi:MAG: chromosomal replication initiator protein DnaA [Proteobacteria bacterium]|nr:chromosomal replication initiator protein DnaA [Pseudomonadota bacterium]
MKNTTNLFFLLLASDLMENFWQDCWKVLRTHFDAEAYDAFIKPVALNIENDTLYITAPNKATERWLRSNVEPLLLQLIKTEFNKTFTTSYRLNGHAVALPEASEAPAFIPAAEKSNSNLPKQRTFDNFIPGRANEIPLIAAKNIAKGDNTVNPLFIYGSTGLGKTHLIQAIGNEYRKNFPQRRVLYINARSFLNDVVNAYRLNQQDKFKQRYQKLDLLIVDDIQYIGGDKIRTQEEFFFLFNTLYEENKSIVISCDRAPSKIKDLPQRLTTRFNAGLPTHITPPEFELRTEIVRQKAQTQGIKLKNDIVYFIAEHVKSNVRELEGAVNRIRAMVQYQKAEPTLALCRDAIADLIGHANTLIHADMIKEKVAHYYHIRTSDLSSQKRHRAIAIPRHIAVYLCRQMTNMSLPEIGRSFGKRNHTTVLHSCRWVEESIKNNPNLWEEIKNLEISIKD